MDISDVVKKVEDIGSTLSQITEVKGMLNTKSFDINNDFDLTEGEKSFSQDQLKRQTIAVIGRIKRQMDQDNEITKQTLKRWLFDLV